jgi:hypothetical protein
MRVNREQPHVLVLPEDRANRQLANGFLLHESLLARKIQVLPEAGGWMNVLHLFNSDHLADMKNYSKRYMILLIDFDKKENRLDKAKEFVPDQLKDRVFILGIFSKPEIFKKTQRGSYEEIGLELAQECHDDRYVIWGHDLLQHNKAELDRLREHVRPILFDLA